MVVVVAPGHASIRGLLQARLAKPDVASVHAQLRRLRGHVVVLGPFMLGPFLDAAPYL